MVSFRHEISQVPLLGLSPFTNLNPAQGWSRVRLRIGIKDNRHRALRCGGDADGDIPAIDREQG
jgi:hypothetical protein